MMGKLLNMTLEGIDDVLAYVSRFMIGKDFAGYCDLATAVGLTERDIAEQPGRTDPYILVTNDGSFLTVYDINGTFQIQSRSDFEELVANLEGRMKGYLRQQGHSISIGFERDPGRAGELLEELYNPLIQTARRVGLDTEDILCSRAARNLPFVAWEKNLLMIYTHPSILTASERQRAVKNKVEKAKQEKLPKIEFGQNPFTILTELKSRHDVFVRQLVQDMEHCGIGGGQGILLTPLSAHEAVRHMRMMVAPEQTPRNYRPVLPGDHFMPHGYQAEDDYSHMTSPLVSYQLCSTDVTVTVKSVKSGSWYNGFLSLELGPQDLKIFADLFASIHKDVPWRVRFDLSPGGLNKLKGRRTLTQFTNMIGDNRSIYDSLTHLGRLTLEDSLVCGMKVSFCTWAQTEDELERQVNALATAISAWGNCMVSTVNGDPMAAWAATIPGFTLKNPANLLVPPLEDALYMMPFQRPATPWADGSVILRTPDGKVFPIELGSALQDTHIDAITSPPGGGKSMLLNVMNFAEIHSPGRTRLPLITIIDVGASSEGLIRLIRDSLPHERKDEAVYLRLQNRAEFAVNPFDTQLGAREPTLKEKDFLIDLLTLFCTDPSSKSAPADCARVSEMLLDIAYRKAASPNSAERYSPMVAPDVDAVLKADEIIQSRPAEWWESASWYEITDLLFEHGHIQLATVAQRYAVPTLSSIIQALNNEAVRELYGSAKLENQEVLLDYMGRCLTAASRMFTLFSGRTAFQLSAETRIVSIDLQDVVGSKSDQGKLATSAMYMFSRHLAARNYFLSEDMILPATPQMYHSYHKARVDDVKQERKIIAYDEFHNTGGHAAFTETITKDGREGRKWGIRIVVVSQYLEDFPNALLDALTSVYVMKYGLADDRCLRQKLHVSPSVINEFKNKARGPNVDGSGSNFLALIRTKHGTISHILTNTIGAHEAWAFTTRADDMALRNKLYESIGTAAARDLLVRKFPLGTAEAHIRILQKESDENESKSVINRLVDKLLAEYQENIIAEEMAA